MVMDEEMEKEYQNFFKEYSDVVTISEVSVMLKVSVATVRAMVKSGRIFGVRIGQTYRIPKRELFKIVEEPFLEVRKNGNSNNTAKG